MAGRFEIRLADAQIDYIFSGCREFGGARQHLERGFGAKVVQSYRPTALDIGLSLEEIRTKTFRLTMPPTTPVEKRAQMHIDVGLWFRVKSWLSLARRWLACGACSSVG